MYQIKGHYIYVDKKKTYITTEWHVGVNHNSNIQIIKIREGKNSY